MHVDPLGRQLCNCSCPIEQSNFACADTMIGVTVSVGGTLARRDDTVDSLVHRTGRLMYLSKGSGRNEVTLEADIDQAPSFPAPGVV
ncbi:hypothetical protein GURASL_32950 [Geotalea uraniireducens]|uniref:GGDEF domain-containing protein n=1 Tax=Geotalea uraniireducens TaxID=351604 RepID=A0ABN6VX07_9BACT|nr:hypothetical protein [Geotalea uraniireducens]BDV44372.1 hypothetical protein GURASL_32950 [Geotalea uraniireducens]